MDGLTESRDDQASLLRSIIFWACFISLDDAAKTSLASGNLFRDASLADRALEGRGVGGLL